MSDMQLNAISDGDECPVAQMAGLNFPEPAIAQAPPVRRKRVAFAMWFAALLGATAVIAMGAAPLISP
jgi:hypothetical protein